MIDSSDLLSRRRIDDPETIFFISASVHIFSSNDLCYGTICFVFAAPTSSSSFSSSDPAPSASSSAAPTSSQAGGSTNRTLPRVVQRSLLKPCDPLSSKWFHRLFDKRSSKASIPHPPPVSASTPPADPLCSTSCDPESTLPHFFRLVVLQRSYYSYYYNSVRGVGIVHEEEPIRADDTVPFVLLLSVLMNLDTWIQPVLKQTIRALKKPND